MKQPKGLGRGLDAIFGTDAVDAKLKPMSQMSEIDITEIIPNPTQPRTQFDEEALDELADSIRQLGVIQPITVKKSGDGKYIIISGLTMAQSIMNRVYIRCTQMRMGGLLQHHLPQWEKLSRKRGTKNRMYPVHFM